MIVERDLDLRFDLKYPIKSGSKIKIRLKRHKNISNFELFRSLMTAWPLIRSKLRSNSKKIQTSFVKKKGSLRDPLFHLGLFSMILFSIVCLGAGVFFKGSIKQESFAFLASVSGTTKSLHNELVLTVPKTGANPLDLSLSQRNSLRGISTSNTLSFQTLGSLVAGTTDAEQSGSRGVIEYIVEPEDTISSVSDSFGISTETIIWANDLSKNSALKTGQKLIILPISGVLHYVKSGDTLSDIAETYKAGLNDIQSFNELSSEDDIYVGDILIIPNGIKPKPVAVVYPQVPLASSYFICPIASLCKITQGLHFYNAVDFSNGVCGSPIFAAASGQILRIKYGYNSGAGNYLTIQHPNGVITMYGHLQSVAVSQGDAVSQGQVVAYMGGQPGTPGAGASTGCHVHFQVQGAKNPFAK